MPLFATERCRADQEPRRRRTGRRWLAGLALAGALLAGLLQQSGAARAQSDSVAPTDVKAIETIIRNYLIENPEVLIEAMAAYEAKQKLAEEADRVRALEANRAALFDDPASPVIGAVAGDVTIVEFFDYRCPYCRVTAARLRDLVAEDPGVRLVMKEFPILSPESEVAARAALAAARQGKYEAFHFALMDQPGDLSERHLRATANKTGVDPDQMFDDMEDREFKTMIAVNRGIARQLKITGTPAMVIGDQVIPGAIELDQLRALVAQVRDNPS